MITYSLSINGAAAVPAEDLGVQVVQRVQQTQGEDTCTLVWPRRTADTLPLAPGDYVQVLRDSTPFFRGRYEQPRTGMQPAAGSITTVLRGPWVELERWYAHRAYLDPTPYDTSGPLQYFYSTHWTLFGWLHTPNPPYQAVKDVLAEFLGRIPGALGAASPYQFVAADLPGATTRPSADETVVDLKIADIVRRALRYLPDCAVWWDYSTTPPTLKMRRLGDETPVAIALGGPPLTSYQVSARRDMVPRAVVVRAEPIIPGQSTYWGGITAKGAPNDGFPTQLDVYPSVPDWTGPDVMTITVSPANVADVPIIGFAQQLYESLQTLRLDGTLVLQGVAGTVRPGSTFAVTGDDPVFAGATAWAQVVTDDLVRDTTTVQLGWPAHLGLADRVSLSDWGRWISAKNRYYS